MDEITRESVEESAFSDPYDGMDPEEVAFMAEDCNVIPIDATASDDVSSDMTWGQSYLGGGGPLTVTDYGRHRSECDTLADFRDFIIEKLSDTVFTQYLKFMNDDKTELADELVAVSKSDGYVVFPYFGGD